MFSSPDQVFHWWHCQRLFYSILPFFKIFSIFVHFCPNFQIFCPFLLFFKQFFSIFPLLSRKGPARHSWQVSKSWFLSQAGHFLLETSSVSVAILVSVRYDLTFFHLSCRLNLSGLWTYWLTASQENNGLLTSIVSSSTISIEPKNSASLSSECLSLYTFYSTCLADMLEVLVKACTSHQDY